MATTKASKAVRTPSLVRASDLSAWAYCQRAWWLANVQGVAHGEPERLAWGSDRHAAHGRSVARAQQLQRAALIVLAAAALLLAVALLLTAR